MRDLGGFSGRATAAFGGGRHVGPIVFFDLMGPATLAPGQGIDVRPHPHIGLATVTYLFAGEIVHRDSLGFVQPIEPGAINWMTAGRGIAHSERTGAALREAGSSLHGLQLWVALPQAHEETAPDFRHHPAATLPAVDVDGACVCGSSWGARTASFLRSETLSPLIYVEARLPEGTDLALPAEPAERAAFVVERPCRCDDRSVAARADDRVRAGIDAGLARRIRHSPHARSAARRSTGNVTFGGTSCRAARSG